MLGLDFAGLDFELVLLPVKLLSDMTRRSGDGFAGVEVVAEVESERELRLLNRDRRLEPPPLSVRVWTLESKAPGMGSSNDELEFMAALLTKSATDEMVGEGVAIVGEDVAGGGGGGRETSENGICS